MHIYTIGDDHKCCSNRGCWLCEWTWTENKKKQQEHTRIRAESIFEFFFPSFSPLFSLCFEKFRAFFPLSRLKTDNFLSSFAPFRWVFARSRAFGVFGMCRRTRASHILLCHTKSHFIHFSRSLFALRNSHITHSIWYKMEKKDDAVKTKHQDDPNWINLRRNWSCVRTMPF